MNAHDLRWKPCIVPSLGDAAVWEGAAAPPNLCLIVVLDKYTIEKDLVCQFLATLSNRSLSSSFANARVVLQAVDDGTSRKWDSWQ